MERERDRKSPGNKGSLFLICSLHFIFGLSIFKQVFMPLR